MNLYGFVGNDGVNWIDRLGLLVFNVNHTRKKYGVFATYGTITITTDDEETNRCCGFPKTFFVIEPPRSRDVHGLLKSSKYNGFIKEEDTAIGKSGRTCPLRFYDNQIPQTPGLSQDYLSGLTTEFQVDPSRGGNIHAGQNGASTDACLIIGTGYKPTLLDGDPSRQPGTKKGSKYIVPGFDYGESRDAYAKLMEAVACATKRNGSFQKVKYSRTDTGAGLPEGTPKAYEGSPTGWTRDDLLRDYNPNYDGVGPLYAIPVPEDNSGNFWNKILRR